MVPLKGCQGCPWKFHTTVFVIRVWFSCRSCSLFGTADISIRLLMIIGADRVIMFIRVIMAICGPFCSLFSQIQSSKFQCTVT
jgi:hypothetical protein